MANTQDGSGPGAMAGDFTVLTEDGKALNGVLADLERSAGRFGAAMTSALTSAVHGGKGLDDILRTTGLRLVDIALSAGLKPLQDTVSASFGAVFDGLTGGIGGAATGRSVGVVPFAGAGGIATPRFLAGLSAASGPAPSGTQAMGPAMAPAAASGSGTAGVPNVTFNVTARDADSFRRSEGQIAAMLTRTVGRGRRGV